MTSKKPTCGVLAGEPVIIGKRCADGGTCHHACTAECWRRDCCAPLGASGLNDDWSAPCEVCGDSERCGVDGCTFEPECADMGGNESVPPAGGEPEVLGYRIESEHGHHFKDTPTHGQGIACTELVDRAHVTRLQAEVERLAETKKSYEDLFGTQSDVISKCNQRRSAAELERDALQSELTKARECLKDLGVDWPEVSDMYQSAPAAKDEVMCRGDKALGTACGSCKRCKARDV